MKKSRLAAVLVTLLLLSLTDLSAQQTAAAPAATATKDQVWDYSFANPIWPVSNVVYRRANNTDLKLDLYLPTTAAKPRPVVVNIHGGGWVAGTKEGDTFNTLPYLQMGFAVVNVEYRLAENSPAPAAVEDCRCALRWVWKNAKKYEFDLSRVIVTGGSAGGHLALTTGLLTPDSRFDRGCTPPDDKRWDKADDAAPKVAAIINWFGITDVNDELAGPNAKGYAVEWLGANPNRDALAKELSPLSMVRRDSPPVLTIHGDKDTLVPYSHGVRLHQALDAAGVKNKLVTIPGGGHGGFKQAENLRIAQEIREFLRELKLLN